MRSFLPSIVELVCAEFGVTSHELHSHNQRPRVQAARSVALWFATSNHEPAAVGRHFGMNPIEAAKTVARVGRMRRVDMDFADRVVGLGTRIEDAANADAAFLDAMIPEAALSLPQDFQVRLTELSALAPDADRGLLRVVAGLLAIEGHAEILRIAAEAIQDATVELVSDGRLRGAADLVAIGTVLSNSASARADRRSAFW